MITPIHHVPSPAALHASFMAIVPRIERYGRVYFRGMKNAETRADAIQEMICLSWQLFLRMAGRGMDVTQLPCALAGYAARSVRGGRRLCGREKAEDVLSARAQRRHGFAVQPLTEESGFNTVFNESLQVDAQTPQTSRARS